LLSTVKNLAEEGVLYGQFRIPCPVAVDVHGEDVCGFKFGIDGKQVVEAAHHEASADEQHEGERHLGSYEGVANACAALAADSFVGRSGKDAESAATGYEAGKRSEEYAGEK
jgi:hypothetical protein